MYLELLREKFSDGPHTEPSKPSKAPYEGFVGTPLRAPKVFQPRSTQRERTAPIHLRLCVDGKKFTVICNQAETMAEITLSMQRKFGDRLQSIEIEKNSDTPLGEPSKPTEGARR